MENPLSIYASVSFMDAVTSQKGGAQIQIDGQERESFGQGRFSSHDTPPAAALSS